MFCSTRRAKYGIALIVRGTIAAAVPTVVPTSRRVNGMIAISRIRNGKDRMVFTTLLTTAKVLGQGAMPPGAWMNSQIPMGVPKSTASGIATPIMAKVCSIASVNSGSS